MPESSEIEKVWEEIRKLAPSKPAKTYSTQVDPPASPVRERFQKPADNPDVVGVKSYDTRDEFGNPLTEGVSNGS